MRGGLATLAMLAAALLAWWLAGVLVAWLGLWPLDLLLRAALVLLVLNLAGEALDRRLERGSH